MRPTPRPTCPRRRYPALAERALVLFDRDGAYLRTHLPRPGRPVATGAVSDRDERLPHIGLSVLDREVGLHPYP
jgi:hypothetical protein